MQVAFKNPWFCSATLAPVSASFKGFNIKIGLKSVQIIREIILLLNTGGFDIKTNINIHTQVLSHKEEITFTTGQNMIIH